MGNPVEYSITSRKSHYRRAVTQSNIVSSERTSAGNMMSSRGLAAPEKLGSPGKPYNQKAFRGNMTQEQLAVWRNQFRKDLVNTIFRDKQKFIKFMMNNYDRITELQQIQYELGTKTRKEFRK